MHNIVLSLFLFCLAVFSSANSLEITRVILSTNNNPNYIQFWPIVAPLWKEMGFQPTLALIADESCPIDTSFGDVIRFAPIPGVPEALQAQAIRLLLPALFPKDGCLISDIDMLPISRSYFVDGSSTCPDESFLVYRDGAYVSYNDRYPMCYVAAKGSIFASVFQVSTPADISALIEYWNTLGLGWNTDEIVLYGYVMEWEKNGGSVVRLGHDLGCRLDRLYWNFDYSTIDLSTYIDCHCPRPYSSYKDTIDPLIQAIRQQLVQPNNL